ncbi:MAG: hypothetical protein Q9162_001395 [Coniocarpon cinnabarinum]
MALLRNGARAVDAIEMAIKVLEDREITNAGYGSNLAIDGVVEGDAVVVDHFGRSGGVGAVAQIKNPIQLARQVLELSNRELTLRRVPPNLLVGQGATDFAFDQGMAVVPHDALISPAARERWNRWKADLRSAERRAKREASGNTVTGRQPSLAQLPPYEERPRTGQPLAPEPKSLRNSVWNEGEPVSPPESATGFRSPSVGGTSTRSRNSSLESHIVPSIVPGTPDSVDSARKPSLPLTADRLAANAAQATQHHAGEPYDATRDAIDAPSSSYHNADEDIGDIDDTDLDIEQYQASFYADRNAADQDNTGESSDSSGSVPLPSITPSPPGTPNERQIDEDLITDTVGAIAIDSEGNIACGASSGGIGMKFRGRVGPAALVGVGAAVCPANNEDKSRMTTACVTSGTGEHMATTLAANVCAERLYNSVRAKRAGGLEPCSDDEAVKAMIEQDFMSLPDPS